MPKARLKASNTDAKGGVYHFYASSVTEWKVDTDLYKLITYMKRRGWPFNIYKVPVDISTPYKINNYEPVVVGTTFITAYLFPKE